MIDVYAKLKEAVFPILEHYHDDLLVIDKGFIDKHPGVPFLHWTRKMGTHMAFMPPAHDPIWPAKGQRVPYLFGTADREHVLKQIVEVARYHNDAMKTTCEAFHFYTGEPDGRLILHLKTEIGISIALEFQRRTLAAWEGKR